MSLTSTFNSFQGHPIFRNQPPHTHFNKSFEDPTDAFFCGLNEVHPFYYKAEQLQDDSAFETHILLDPRTQQLITKVLYDHTPRGQRPRVFKSGIKSGLTKAQHVECFKVLLAWQQRTEVNEKALIIYRRLRSKREREQAELQQYALKYAESHKELIYAPTKRLVEYYKRWYGQHLPGLMARVPNEMYNTHAGLPHVSTCKGEGEKTAELANVQLLDRRGWVPVLKERFGAEMRSIQHRFEAFMNVDEPKQKKINEFDGEIEKSLQNAEEKPSVFIPLDTLLFLLTAGDDVDLPNEVFVEIRAVGEGKVLKFDEPLPARNCGWHTHKQMMEIAYANYVTKSCDTRWVNVQREGLQVEDNQREIELNGTTPEPVDYKLYKIEDFMESMAPKHKPNTREHGKALVKWSLLSAESTEHPTRELFHLLTTLPLAPAVNATAPALLSSFSIKLEYQPQFGCEVMTKYELLKEWLRQSLLPSNELDGGASKCLRVAADTLQLLLEEELALAGIEQQLAERYQIRLPSLLSNLAEFLRLLTNMPPGQFLLRFSAKYPDKLMLCAPSQEVTPNTLKLRELLQVEPDDLSFLTLPHHLPISETLCSIMHCFHRIMPCAFLPVLEHHNKEKLVSATRSKMLAFNVNAPQQRLKAKLEEKKRAIKTLKNRVAAQRKREKRQKLKAKEKSAVQTEQQEDNELEKFMMEF